MKKTMLGLAFAAAATALACLGSAAAAAPAKPPPPQTQPSLPIGSTWISPAVHKDFCRRLPAECKPGEGAPKVMQYTDALMRTLSTINRRVNDEIKYTSDFDVYGVEEFWNIPQHGRGDCEDIASVKRRDLIARGWPPSALLLTIVKAENGGGHLVLVVCTDAGDYVLDNRTDLIKRWDRTPYEWLFMQDTRNPHNWRKIQILPIMPPVVGTAPVAKP